MHLLFVCDFNGCIYDVEHKDILILKTSFNLSTIKRLIAAHKDQIGIFKNYSMYKSKQ
jgi:hypothetical protein